MRAFSARDSSCYPLLMDGGVSAACPDTHPVRLVTLFMELSFAVQDVEPFRSEAMNPSQPFVLAVRRR